MAKITSICVLLFLVFVFIGCQKDSIDFDENDLTHIEVNEWVDNNHVATIIGRNSITRLVNEIETTSTESLVNTERVTPDCKVIFKNNEEIIYEMNYYTNSGDGYIASFCDSPRK
ncbi:hypothetical protein [Salipaludibacillus sp. CF4.18]|uniref:hypothetical protein n=1 Tax=Salipaludibacillus sp. CF4.18 TaxID=3373081 RepID=UPI003EE7D8F2